MSWYVTLQGRQIWVDRDEDVYTVGDPPDEELPLVNLAYLSVGSSKAMYAEHMIDEEGSKRGKAKEKQGGRQRGFVVRVDHDTRTKVLASMQGAIDLLMQNGHASRIDIDDAGSDRKKKGKRSEPAEEILPPLGPNECRVEIVSRCQHVGHGKGYQVSVLEHGSKQKINIFTSDQEFPVDKFHQQLVAAVEASGGKTALGRMAPCAEDGAGGPGKFEDKKPKKRDEAQEDEDDWLSSVMGAGRAVAVAAEKAEKKEEGEGSAAANEGGGEEAAGGYPKPKPKAKRELPPWLRR